jgi:hypothetical protein
MTGETIPTHPHVVDGSERLTAEQALAYLDTEGYTAEAVALIAMAIRFPCDYKYTADRRRYVARIMPGDHWLAGDCAESEERIKSLARARRGRI